ncbi:MAG: glycosyltransferase family 2 protein [Pseudomonadota bacterium]
MTSRLISVIIPAFNREKHIACCLDSVMRQTFNNLEIIVLDDCSTDNTIAIVKRFNDPRVKLIALEKNIGAQAARNRGIHEAAGDWIAFQDSDDEWLPDKLTKQLNELEKVNFDLFTVVHSNCFTCTTEKGKKEFWELPFIQGENVFPALLKNSGPMFQAIVVSKIALEKIGYLDEKVPSYQEWDTAIQLARHCRFIHIKEPLFIYNIHGDDRISKNLKLDVQGYEYIMHKFESDIKAIGGAALWNEHLFTQLKRCLEFQLWDEADAYLLRLKRARTFNLKDYKLCGRYKLRPSDYFNNSWDGVPLLKRIQIKIAKQLLAF